MAWRFGGEITGSLRLLISSGRLDQIKLNGKGNVDLCWNHFELTLINYRGTIISVLSYLAPDKQIVHFLSS